MPSFISRWTIVLAGVLLFHIDLDRESVDGSGEDAIFSKEGLTTGDFTHFNTSVASDLHDESQIISFYVYTNSTNPENASIIASRGDNLTFVCEGINDNFPQNTPKISASRNLFLQEQEDLVSGELHIHAANISCIYTACYYCQNFYSRPIEVKIPCKPFFDSSNPPLIDKLFLGLTVDITSYPGITSIQYLAHGVPIPKESILDNEFKDGGLEYTQNPECSLLYPLVLWFKRDSVLSETDVTVRITNALGDLDFVVPKSKCLDVMEDGVILRETEAGGLAIVPCPEGYKGLASKVCNRRTEWEPASYLNCTRVALDQVFDIMESPFTSDALANISKILAEVFSEDSGMEIVSGDIKGVVGIFARMGGAAKQLNLVVNRNTVQALTTTVNTLLSSADSAWKEVSSGDSPADAGAQLLQSMEDITQTILKSENFTDLTVNKKNIVLELKKIKTNQIIFPDPKNPNKETFMDSETKIKLSQSKEESFKYSVIVYKDVVEKFTIKDIARHNRRDQSTGSKNIILNSNVLSFSVEPKPEFLNQEPLQLTFRKQIHTNRSTQHMCAYLLVNTNTSSWSTDGCVTKDEDDKVVCSCTHLTNFAVLMSPYEIDETNRNVLGFISVVGISISLVCLVITIATYGIMWRFVKGDKSVLHIHLSSFLFLGYVIFLIGIGKTDNSITCAIVAGLLHFLFVSVFFVMLAQGILILKSVTSVSSKSIRKYLYPLMYGGPTLVLIISLVVTRGDGYGSDKACWLDNRNGLMWAFIGPAFLVLLVNVVILIVVLRIMQTSHAMMDKNLKTKTRSLMRSVCVLSPILGTTWAFGVLSISSDQVVFQYLFALCNSLQGLFIFIFQCVLQHQIRNGMRLMIRRYRATSSMSSSKLTHSSQSDARPSKSETKSDAMGISSGMTKVSESTRL